MIKVERFDTKAVWPAQRIARWTDRNREQFGRLRFDVSDNHEITWQIAAVNLGPLTLRNIVIGEGGCVVHTVPAEPEDPLDDALILSIVQSGWLGYHFEDKSLELTPGDILLRDVNQPLTIDSPSSCDLMTARLPFDLLLEHFDEPLSLVGRTHSSAEPESKILSLAVALAFQATDTEPHLLAKLILYAILVLPNRSLNAALRTTDAATLRMAKQILAKEFNNPSLTLGDVASEIRTHPRKVQRDFQRAGTTFQRDLLKRRLTYAAKRLAEGHKPKITELAFASGFTDPAYFSRAFSKMYLCSPTAFWKKSHPSDK